VRKSSIQAVIFDLGGVVFESPLAFIREYEIRHGLSEHFIARLVGGYGGEDSAWHRLERGELPLAAPARRRFGMGELPLHTAARPRAAGGRQGEKYQQRDGSKTQLPHVCSIPSPLDAVSAGRSGRGCIPVHNASLGRRLLSGLGSRRHASSPTGRFLQGG